MNLIRIVLDWTLDAKHAVFQAADELYAQQDIDLQLVEPASKSVEALAMLQNGEYEMAINYPHNMMLARDRFPDLVSVGALVKRNTEGLLSLAKSGIVDPTDIRGKKLGIGPSPVSQAQVEVFLSSNGIERDQVDIVSVGFNGEDLLIAGEIDVLDGVGYALPRTRRKGYAVHFLPFAEFGVPDSPFLIFAARRAWAEAQGDVLRSFFACTGQGFQRVSGWGDSQWRDYAESIPGRNGEEEREVWDCLRPLILGSGGLFKHIPAELEALQTILMEKELLRSAIDLGSVFLNRFVP